MIGARTGPKLTKPRDSATQQTVMTLGETDSPQTTPLIQQRV